ncbi:histone deacetylase family protein [Halolamina salifodinae]|uniref:Acetoin utilization deacetylase AcuC-like enzyme n=1 Tax=Halolamina salifodinae TaxID=1202767 RepID=A0A8T4H3R7_9EURY|nr:histone deacetylase [Halolamina salifodinae]MBP1988275.1 acetoin utilization deacetylase AcuC-like enzyme [Halolamina salifodinae]
MQFGYSERCLDHDTGPRHPESPDRMRAIREALKERHGVSYVDSDSADGAAIERAHDAEHVDAVREFCEDGGGEWDPDTVAGPDTYDVALQSAGLSIWAAEAALDGADGRDTPFALGRPPGHHAESDEAMGFCFFNNAAVAARDAIATREEVDRVAIWDWDVHHGNGTQEICYDDPDVFYASTHEAGLYPGSGEVEETGEGAGEGTTMNVPLSAGCGDPEYLHAFEEAIAPAIERFDPDLLLISAGFDAHRHDPISRMRVSTEGYAQLTEAVKRLSETVDAPLAFILEGGYGLDTLSESVAVVHETFDGREPVVDGAEPTDEVADLVAELREIHGL